MYRELKYVVTDKDAFAIFSDTCDHSAVARGLWGKPVGAGKCTIAREADSEKANVHCYGESSTLGLKSRPEDEKIINGQINSMYE